MFIYEWIWGFEPFSRLLVHLYIGNINFLSLFSGLGASFWRLANFDSFFFNLKLFFCTSWLYFVRFLLLIYFWNDFLVLWNQNFHEMDAKKWIKMQKKLKKLADLVCTNEIFLYKSGQTSNKWAIWLLVEYLLMFGQLTSVVKCHQTNPNETMFCWCKCSRFTCWCDLPLIIPIWMAKSLGHDN